jgi:hypothetical protein
MSTQETPPVTDDPPVVSAPYEPRSDAEIKQIAIEIEAGKIWTSEHCPNLDAVRASFLTIGFCTPELANWMQQNKIAVIYEYVDRAGPLSVNGMPSFFGAKMISEDDWKRVLEKVTAIRAALASI